MLGTAAVLWIGLATYGAYRICFPEFYTNPPRAFPRSPADPRAAFGADFEELTLTRRDGKKLAAWFIPGIKQAAIVVLHGGGGDRRTMLPYLKFIHAAGYPAIAIDEIDHGASDHTGLGVGYGWHQRGDVMAAAEALRSRGFHKIGALGVSQGAAAALMAQAEAPTLSAIVSDSSYANLDELLREVPSIAQLNPAFTATMFWELRFMLGRGPEQISPADAAARLSGCALMVIQGASDRLTPVHNGEAIYAAARGPKEMWIVPSADHGGALWVAPDAYARRVIGFLYGYL